MFQLDDLKNHPLLKWTMYIVGGIVIISFVLFYGWHPSEERQGPAFARIKSNGLTGGSEELSAEELERATQQAMNEKAMVLPPQALRNMPQSVMERLVTLSDRAQEAANVRLLERQAKELGVHVTREQIIALLNEQQNLTDEKLMQAAAQQGLSVEAFIESLRRMEEQDIVRKLQQQTAHASLYEVWQEYVLSKEKIKLQLAAYPISNFTASIPVTDAD